MKIQEIYFSLKLKYLQPHYLKFLCQLFLIHYLNEKYQILENLIDLIESQEVNLEKIGKIISRDFQKTKSINGFSEISKTLIDLQFHNNEKLYRNLLYLRAPCRVHRTNQLFVRNYYYQ